MSDYHEMYENWNQLGYDPAYVGEERSEQGNEPVDINTWARIDEVLRRKMPLGRISDDFANEDLEGGF